jgi:hypothetical protein
MSRGRQRIQQSDLTKAIKAVAAAKVAAKIVIDASGQISVLIDGTDQRQSPANDDPSEWATSDDQN